MVLECVERELGEGRGVVGGLRRALLLRDRDRDGGDGGGEGSDSESGAGERVLQKTKLWGLLDARKVWLRESTVAQLEDGFERAFRVDLAPSSADSESLSTTLEKGKDGGKGGNRVAGRGGRGEEEDDDEDGWGLDDDADDDDVDSKMVIDNADDDDGNEDRGNEETHQPQQEKQRQRQRLYCRIELAGEHHGVPLRVVTGTCLIVLFVSSRCVALRFVVSENEYANHPPTHLLYLFFSFLVNQPPPPSTNQAPSTNQPHLHPHATPTHQILTSLHALGHLQPLLHALQTRLLKHVVRPLVGSWVPGGGAGGGGGSRSSSGPAAGPPGSAGSAGRQGPVAVAAGVGPAGAVREQGERTGMRMRVRYIPPTAQGDAGGAQGGKGVLELFAGRGETEGQEQEQEQEQGQEQELWRSLTVFFQALRDALPPASSSLGASEPTTTTTTADVLASFHRHLVAETLHIVLDTFLLRSLPLPRTLTMGSLREVDNEQQHDREQEHEERETEKSLLGLRRWSEVLRRAQEFEETLVAATTHTTHDTHSATSPHTQAHAHKLSVIRDFVDSRAGAVFAAQRKQYVLGTVRALVLPSVEAGSMDHRRAEGGDGAGNRSSGWGGWASRVVVRERVVQPPPTSTVGPAREKGQPGRVPLGEGSSKNDPTLQQREGGWGFDDVIDLTKAESMEPVPAGEKTKGGQDADEADGWGFDEEDPIVRDTDAKTPIKAVPSPSLSPDTPTPAPPTEITAPKPIRQARKIGKKGKSGAVAVASSDGGSTTGTPLLGGASPSVDDVGVERFGGSPASMGYATGAMQTTDVSAPALGNRSLPPPVTAEREGDDGWSMEWEVESHPPPPVTAASVQSQGPTVVRERLRVSVVLDTVVQIVRGELTFIAALQNNE